MNTIFIAIFVANALEKELQDFKNLIANQDELMTELKDQGNRLSFVYSNKSLIFILFLIPWLSYLSYIFCLNIYISSNQ